MLNLARTTDQNRTCNQEEMSNKKDLLLKKLLKINAIFYGFYEIDFILVRAYEKMYFGP